MTERVAFLMKDLVIFAASFYLLKQDVMRVKVGRRRNDVVVGNESSGLKDNTANQLDLELYVCRLGIRVHWDVRGKVP